MNVLSNCRPIWNLPFLSKVLEKAISKQPCSFLLPTHILEVFKSGFTPFHSTETALVKVLNNLLFASDSGYISVLMLLDLSAAFDTVDHLILLDRFENLVGIGEQALSWFRSYLSDQYQFVNFNNLNCHQSTIRYGVPQGSVLEPLLFSLYMLPLGQIIRKHSINFRCYADDTQLYLSVKPVEVTQLSKMEACLLDIKEWMAQNFFLFNSDKTEIMVVGPKSLTIYLPTCRTLMEFPSRQVLWSKIFVLLWIQILHLMHILKTSQGLLFITWGTSPKFGNCCPCIMLKYSLCFCYFKIRLLQCSFVWMCKFLFEGAAAYSKWSSSYSH